MHPVGLVRRVRGLQLYAERSFERGRGRGLCVCARLRTRTVGGPNRVCKVAYTGHGRGLCVCKVAYTGHQSDFVCSDLSSKMLPVSLRGCVRGTGAVFTGLWTVAMEVHCGDIVICFNLCL